MRFVHGAILLTTCWSSVWLLSAGFARAEQTFELFNGGRIVGELLNPDEEPRKSYQIQTAWGVVTLPAAHVVGTVEKSPAEKWYEENRPRGPLDVAGHLQLAAECAARGLRAQQVYHLEQVLKLDPNHEEARKALGYSRINGQWVRVDDWYRSLGYVRSEGGWRLPQEVLLAKEEAQRKEAQGQWNRTVRMWRQWLLKNPERAAEAAAKFRALDDPAAADALIRLLAERNEPPELRRLYLTALSNLPGTSITYELVKLALTDADSQIRESATQALVQRGDRAAVQKLISALEKYARETTPVEENVAVNRIASLLGKLGAPEATLPLIRVLVTRHKQTVSLGSGNLNPTFSSGGAGGGGLTLGNSTKTVVGELQNPGVRDALISLHPGVNLGFDVQAWHAWFQQQNAPAVVDLRRDP
jgi:hypothetical protein